MKFLKKCIQVRVALYRDGKATFIENELTIRKMGFPENQVFFQIQSFQIQEDDSILIGSDGRDDIQMGYDEQGNRNINADETLFLQLIEKAEGDIEAIYQKSIEIGTITDDYTLIKIMRTANITTS